MSLSFTYLPYADTGYFSQLVVDYLNGTNDLKEFYTYTPDKDGLEQAIADRKNFPIDRKVLTDTLRKQYEALPKYEAVDKNIELLAKDTTYTVCTAHQPNLMTGYLYFIYKIVHAIKLAEELKAAHPENDFVPVYYMGSEDNDLDELGTFRYEDKKFVWDANGQTGAVGRMDTKSLKPLLAELFKLLGPPGNNLEEVKQLLEEAYLKHNNISDATQHLVHQLFGRFGLVVLNPDETSFKKSIIPIIKDDLLQQTAVGIVTNTIDKLDVHYKVQAHPRPINLFYLHNQLRERIEKTGDSWHVVNTDITWSEQELMAEVDTHPERFSPNVILRGLFQETILPNVAFIGGGAEVAYWLQLKALFTQFHVFYPAILLRQSALWINSHAAKTRKQSGLSIADIFQKELALVKNYVLNNSEDDWQTSEETKTIEQTIDQLKQKAVSLDPTLRSSADAVLAKIKHQLQVMEKKMYRAEKRKMQTQLARIAKLKKILFPNDGLQERADNFLPYYLQQGSNYFTILKEATRPLDNTFLIIEESMD